VRPENWRLLGLIGRKTFRWSFVLLAWLVA
jgi:hypothetical protein